MVKKVLAVAFCLTVCIIIHAQKADNSKLSSAEFLKKTRVPQGRESWAFMKGEASHMRYVKVGNSKERKVMDAELAVSIDFTPTNTIGQVVIEERLEDKKVPAKKESFKIMQTYTGSKDSTTIIPGAKNPPQKQSVMGNFGIHPQDLTMSFLYWDYQKELKRDTCLGYDCRVFLLKNPDAKAAEKYAKVYIVTKYLFPLKVTWYKDDKTALGQVKGQYRTMEVSSFKEEGDFVLVAELSLKGPGWNTRISFDDTEAGYTNDKKPEGFYKTL